LRKLGGVSPEIKLIGEKKNRDQKFKEQPEKKQKTGKPPQGTKKPHFKSKKQAKGNERKKKRELKDRTAGPVNSNISITGKTDKNTAREGGGRKGGVRGRSVQLWEPNTGVGPKQEEHNTRQLSESEKRKMEK